MNDSHKKYRTSPPRRFLVHDEIERVPSRKGVPYEFRIRIWRSEGTTPVVLVSQTQHGPPPHWMVNKLANYIFSAHLGYPEEGMLYFEDERHENGVRVLQQNYFEFFGYALRMRLFKPSPQTKEWEFLEYAVGEEIAR